tara:strand:- start:207 stop:596 length:390 start_codon:yes stop_codon:yes gene_type:complete
MSSTVKVTGISTNGQVMVTAGRYTIIEKEVNIGEALSTDNSLFIDPTTNQLRLNTGEDVANFTYSSGAQVFTLPEKPVRIIYVAIKDGKILMDDLADWSINTETKEITIITPLEVGDKVKINYQFLISE